MLIYKIQSSNGEMGCKRTFLEIPTNVSIILKKSECISEKRLIQLPAKVKVVKVHESTNLVMHRLSIL